MSRLVRLAQLTAVVVVLLALPAASAQALVSIEGTGEPAYTNTTTNTVHFRYAGDGWSTYRLHFNYIAAGSIVYQEWTGDLGNPASAVSYANWTGVVNSLVSGTSYGICTYGETYDIAGNVGLWAPSATSNSTCMGGLTKSTTTTIDRSVPTVSSVSVEGTATYSNKGPGQSLALAGLYSDSISPPWPATYICIKKNLDPATACNGTTFDYTPVCSNRVGTGTQNNPFSCVYNLGAGDPDGPLTFCARASDSSLPDKPASTDQFSGLTSSDANISGPSCGYVILDRGAPQVGIGGGAATATTGQLLSFSASATDPAAGISPGSGVTGNYTWSWGDNTANGTGVNASHTFTSAGTFQVKLTTADNAGNAAEATKTVTVTAPAGGGGTGTGGTGGTGGAGGTPGTGTPGGGTTNGSGGSITPPPTAQQIAQQTGASGAGATQTTSAGSLDVLTAKKLRISKKLKSLPIALTADQPGAATFALVRGGRIVSQAGLTVTKAGSLGFKLKLPKKLKAGKYGLKITFKATGAAKASTRTITITFAAARRKAKATSSGAAGLGPVSGGAPAVPGLGTPLAVSPARGAIGG